jgi:opacity protein-like surface antigen
VSTSAAFVNNTIERISKVESNAATVSTYKNIGKNERYGLNCYLNYRPTQKFSIYMNGGINYSKLEAFSEYAIVNDGFSYRGYMGGRLTVWKNGTVSANGSVSSASIRLQGKSSSYFYAGFGLSQYFLKRKLMLSFCQRSFLYKNRDQQKLRCYFSSRSEYSYLAQTVRISMTYNFGKMDLKVRKASRGIQNDDLKGGSSSEQGETQQQ